METNDSASSTNTVLLVIVLLILVGFGVWWFTMRNSAKEDTSDINVDVNLPSGTTETTTPEKNY